MHARIPTWPVAAGSLLLGFAVAQASGVRPLGGLVLAAGLGWCVLRWRRSAGPVAMAGLALLYLVAFALSHVLADALTTPGALALVAVIVGAASALVADQRDRGRAAA